MWNHIMNIRIKVLMLRMQVQRLQEDWFKNHKVLKHVTNATKSCCENSIKTHRGVKH